jgi:hypothetical protein
MLSVSTPGSRQHPGFGSASSMSLTDAYSSSSGRQARSQVPLSLRQSVQQRYLAGEGSEYDLFDRVQRRVASRKTNEVCGVVVSYLVFGLQPVALSCWPCVPKVCHYVCASF